MSKYNCVQTIIIILLLTFSSFQNHAQNHWTLEQCIEYALKHNSLIGQQTLGIKEAQLLYKQSKLNYIPSFGLGSEYTTSFGRALDPTTYEFLKNETIFSFNIANLVETELFGGLKKFHAKRQAALNCMLVQADLEKIKDDLILDIIKSYLQILMNKENIKIAEYKIEILKTQIERTLALIRAGKNTEGDMLQLQTQMCEAENNLLYANNQHAISLLTICQLIEIPDYKEFDIVIIGQFKNEMQLINVKDTNIFYAAQSLPQIEGAKLRIAVSQKDIMLAKAMLYPTISFKAGYSSSYSSRRKKILADENDSPVLNDQNELIYTDYRWGKQIKDNVSSYLLFSVNIPIFNQNKIRTKITSYQLVKEKAEYDLIIKQKELKAEINQALINAETAWQRYNLLINNKSTNQKNFDFIEKKLNMGKSTYYDYIIALNNFILADIQLIQAKYEYLFCTKIIDFYIGKEIVM